MKCINPLNNFFHCLANGKGVGWWGCQNVHLKKCCRKFDEMPKSTSIFFHCLAHQEGWFGGGGCQNVHLNQNAGNLMKCLITLKIFLTV